MKRMLPIALLSLTLAAPALACDKAEQENTASLDLQQWIQLAEDQPTDVRASLSVAEQVIGAAIDLGAQVSVWTQGSAGQWDAATEAKAGLDQLFDFVAGMAGWAEVQAETEASVDGVAQADGKVRARSGRKATVKARR